MLVRVDAVLHVGVGGALQHPLLLRAQLPARKNMFLCFYVSTYRFIFLFYVSIHLGIVLFYASIYLSIMCYPPLFVSYIVSSDQQL